MHILWSRLKSIETSRFSIISISITAYLVRVWIRCFVLIIDLSKKDSKSRSRISAISFGLIFLQPELSISPLIALDMDCFWLMLENSRFGFFFHQPVDFLPLPWSLLFFPKLVFDFLKFSHKSWFNLFVEALLCQILVFSHCLTSIF